MSEYFQLPPYNDDQPIVEHPFYQWLTANVDRSAGGHSKLLTWLRSLGFRVGKDALSPHDVGTLHFVEDHLLRCIPWYEPHAWKDLFFGVWHLGMARPDEQFFVTGPGRCVGYYKITQKLRDMVEGTGWIYDVHPSTTYFEVIEGRLYAKYQQIIGSRYICDISDYSKEK